MRIDLPENLCGSCSNCCRGSLVKISDSDLLRWRFEQNYHIILCVEEFPSGAAFLMHKKNLDCIFLENGACSIYETRPEVCRKFPHSRKHALEFNCKFAENLK